MSIKPYIATEEVLDIKIEVNSKSNGLEQFLLSVNVKNELNKIPSCELEFVIPNPETEAKEEAIVTQLKKEDKIELSFAKDNDYQRVFKGIIEEQNLELTPDGENTLIVKCKGHIYKLTKNKSVFKDELAFSDILDEFMKVVKNDVKNQIELPDSVASQKFVNDPNTTMWDFILNYLDSMGLMLQCSSDAVTVVDINAKPPEAKFLAENGINVFSFEAKYQPGEEITKVTFIKSNEAETEVELMVYESSSDLRPMPNEIEINKTNIDTSDCSLEAEADTIFNRSIQACISGSLETYGNTACAIGDYITFKKLNPIIEDKSSIINSIEHKIENGCWKSSISFGLENNSFSEKTESSKDAKGGDQAPGANLKKEGVFQAFVTDLEDPEGKYRIKVKIPVLSPKGEGYWARLSTVQAGDENGSFFIPEIGEEVIVSFLGNNVKFPVILGRLYNKNYKPPYQIQKENNKLAIVSRKKSKIVLDDESSSIEIATSKGNKILLSEEDSGICIEDQNGNKICMDKKGITIESAMDLILKAKSNLQVEAINSSLKSDAVMEVKGSIIKLN